MIEDPDRRGVIRLLGAGAAGGVAGCASLPGAAVEPVRFAADPFSLGVASGDPLSDGFVIWTRLAPDPLNPAATPQRPIAVTWEVAEDETFARIVAAGRTRAEPAWAHAVHVEAGGLKPGRPYAYRFHAGGVTSPTGRAKTAPLLGARLDSLSFAVCSCQSYSTGFYPAYADLAARAPDLVIHVGDYIYTKPWTDPVRRHPVPEAVTLDDYRALYAAAKSDPALMAAHAAAPWLAIWDDHEVFNDYRGLHAPEGLSAQAFAARRRNAYQAYFEHMPLRRRARPSARGMALHQRSGFGDLVQFDQLDTRQFRDDHPCRGPEGETPGWIACDAAAPGRTLLGDTQEDWLARGYGVVGARWNIIVQTTQLTTYERDFGGARRVSSDRWAAYPAARDRLLALLAGRPASNPVVVGGDIHAFFAAPLQDPATGAPAAVELVTGAISSGGGGQGRYDAENGFYDEHLDAHYFDNRWNGYLACTARRDSLVAEARVVESVRDPESPARTLARLTVPDGAATVMVEA